MNEVIENNHLNSLECETLVIGGGIAGCWTALKLAERGVDTLLLFYQETDRGGSLGSTNLSVGAINTAPITRRDYSDWLSELGRGQAESSVVQVTIDYLEEEIEALKKFDSLKKIELGVALASGSGKKLITKLIEHLKAIGVRVVEDAWVVRIEATESECRGVQYQQGNEMGVVSAASIVLANGGYSGLFQGAVRTGTYGSIHGRFLQAGGLLSNLEFIFKHGYGQPDLGKLTPTEELPGVEIYDSDGVHVLWLEEELFYGRGTNNHFQAFMTWQKDENKTYFVDFRYCKFHRVLKSLLEHQLSAGTEYSKEEYLPIEEFIDVEQQPAFYLWLESVIREQHYSFSDFLKIKKLTNASCPGDKHRIRQIAYFSMGGILHHEFLTNLKNVYVNGEAMHDYGAHRVGGLPWALYLCAARKIGDDIASIKKREKLIISSVTKIPQLSNFDPKTLEEIQVKLFEFLERGKDEIQFVKLASWLRSERENLHLQSRTLDDSYAYLLLAEAIVKSSIARRESRGCFFRSDYTQEDYRLAKARTVTSYNAETNAVVVDCVDRASILDLVINRESKKLKMYSTEEKNNAAYFLLKKHLSTGKEKCVAIEHEQNKITYHDLNVLVDQYAFFLFSQGLVFGDRVAIHLRDSPHWIAIFLACMQRGLIAVPLNTFSKEADLLFFLEDSQARILISEESLLSLLKFESICFPDNTHVIRLEDIHPLKNEGLGECVPIVKNSIGLILYTSGSSGKPKGAIHSHADIQFTAEHFALENLKPSNEDRFYSSSRLFFAYGLGNSLTFPLYFGCTSILFSNVPPPLTVLDMLEEKKVTHFFSIPTIYAAILKNQNHVKNLKTLKLCVSAGEPLSSSLAKRWVHLLNRPLTDGIGTTEALHIFCCNHYFVDRPTIIGKVVDGYNMRLLDDNNFSFNKVNEPGNLAVSGGSLAMGYWNNQSATETTFINNLLLTGDRYLINENNEYVYLGRRGDLYKVSGLWVSALEIESALKDFSYLKDAALTTFIDSTGAQKTAIFVTAAEDEHIELSSHAPNIFKSTLSTKIMEDLKSVVSEYKLPNYIFVYAELPRTATGKVMKYHLKEFAVSYANEQVQQQASLSCRTYDSEIN